MYPILWSFFYIIVWLNFLFSKYISWNFNFHTIFCLVIHRSGNSINSQMTKNSAFYMCNVWEYENIIIFIFIFIWYLQNISKIINLQYFFQTYIPMWYFVFTIIRYLKVKLKLVVRLKKIFLMPLPSIHSIWWLFALLLIFYRVYTNYLN